MRDGCDVQSIVGGKITLRTRCTIIQRCLSSVQPKCRFSAEEFIRLVLSAPSRIFNPFLEFVTKYQSISDKGLDSAVSQTQCPTIEEPADVLVLYSRM
jgi:hypothetical protein